MDLRLIQEFQWRRFPECHRVAREGRTSMQLARHHQHGDGVAFEADWRCVRCLSTDDGRRQERQQQNNNSVYFVL